MDEPATLLRARDAAKRLAVSERTLLRLTKDGALPSVQFRRSVRYDVADLLAFIDRQKNLPPQAA